LTNSNLNYDIGFLNCQFFKLKPYSSANCCEFIGNILYILYTVKGKKFYYYLGKFNRVTAT
jgi:hypothetical protein